MLRFSHLIHHSTAGTIAALLAACGSVEKPAVPDAASSADAGPDATSGSDAPIADASVDARPVIPSCVVTTPLITDIESADSGYGTDCVRGGWTVEALNGTTSPRIPQSEQSTDVIPEGFQAGTNNQNTQSRFAIHVSGSGQQNIPGGAFAYAQVTATLHWITDDYNGSVDASAFTGIQFYGKVTAGALGVRLTVGNLYTDPVGGICTPGGENRTDCYDNPGADLQLTTNDRWVRYQIPFASLTQYDFGYPSPVGASFPKDAITHIKWDIGIPEVAATEPWELWIDDLKFY